jgi:molecular chaperone DnaK
MGKVIGIDLGTTNSCAAVVENGEPVIIPSASGTRTTPSVVAFTKQGERLVGDIARRQQVVNADRTISSVKRHMGTDWSVRIDGKVYRAPEISAMILSQIRKDAEAFLGESVTQAVITVPAYFNDAQRQATRDAGTIAGLEVLRIINEPTSAALSYGLDHGQAQKVMVYDLGGGTFDVSIIEIGEGIIEVLSTCGDNHLGGDDFDERITEWILDEFRKTSRINVKKDMAAMQRIREAAEQAKKELATAQETRISLPYLAMNGKEPVHLELTLTRAKMNELIRDLIDRTEGPVRQALSDASLAPKDLDRVLLVGGSSRVVAVQDKVRAMTGKEPSRNINPDECVAMGAAIEGSTLSGNALISRGTGQSLVLFDVTPMTLSIETVGEVSTPLIERNTTIPTKLTKTFYAATPYQRDVEIRVLQGDRPLARDNKLIGKFRLSGIKRAASGLPQIDVTFDIDANGLLKVSAQDQVTGKEKSITITASDRMTQDEVMQARAQAQMYEAQDSLRRQGLDLYQECEGLTAKASALGADRTKVPDKARRKEIESCRKDLTKAMGRFNAQKISEQMITDMQNAKTALEQVMGDL